MLQKLTRSHRGFTLVEVMIVMAIIALLASIGVPNYLRARKRSQATRVLQDLRMIDSAIDEYAVEYSRPPGTVINWSQVQLYVKTGTPLYNSNGLDLFGNTYTSLAVDSIPKVPTATFNALSDIAPASFWSPYK
jgi:prepilin-type N-terminal cleavage/methylation domain-containing protein